MLTTRNAAGLVAGGDPKEVRTMWIEVMRPFRYDGAPRASGERLQVPDSFGAEMVAFGKAVAVEAPAAPPKAEAKAKEKDK